MANRETEYLVRLLKAATAVLEADSDRGASIVAMQLIRQCEDARANGAPEARLRCMFGEYRGSDEIAAQLKDEITSRLHLYASEQDCQPREERT